MDIAPFVTSSFLRAIVKGEVCFFALKPYNKDIYNHIPHSIALLWQKAQSWELELIADITVGWTRLETTEEHVHSANQQNYKKHTF